MTTKNPSQFPPITVNNIKDIADKQHAADLVNFLTMLPMKESCTLLEALSEKRQAEIISYYPIESLESLAECFGAVKLASILNHMSHDDRAYIIKALDEPLYTQTLQAMAETERIDICRLTAYPEGSAGALMTTDYAVLPQESTVADALANLRLQAPDKETINRAYIIDEQRRLLGSIRLQTLILSNPKSFVKDVMEQQTPFLHASDSREFAAQQFQKYDMLALPVLDAEERLVGIITHDDAMDILQAEATEDFHKAATIGKIDGNIRHASGWLLYQKRIFWLILLVFGNIFSGAGIAYFEDTITAYVALVFFLPLLIDSGGNAGSQAATLMVRALATGDVKLKDWRNMLGREFLVAAGLGVTMALAVSTIGFYRGGMEIALVVALTMVLVVIVGSIIGMSLPFALSRLKLDPATASAPLITSIADATGVIIYFTIATFVLF